MMIKLVSEEYHFSGIRVLNDHPEYSYFWLDLGNAYAFLHRYRTYKLSDALLAVQYYKISMKLGNVVAIYNLIGGFFIPGSNTERILQNHTDLIPYIVDILHPRLQDGNSIARRCAAHVLRIVPLFTQSYTEQLDMLRSYIDTG